MALNPIAYTEHVVRSFLRYQLTAYPFADDRLHDQMRDLLSLDETRRSPLLKGPYVSLSRPFRQGAAVDALIRDGLLHPHLRERIPETLTHLYGHQERAVRAIAEGRTTLVSTGTGSGKTECFLYPIISRCLGLRDDAAPPGISAVIVYPMNALAEDQLMRLRGLLAGTGIPFGMYVGKTPEHEADVAGVRLSAGSSRADYEARLGRARREGSSETVYPAEEVCSREVMRSPGRQPRILLTNVKQLELLLTRQQDVELFAGARLDFLVFDEAHTFTGALGAETACLIRRLRAFCWTDPARTTCVATSATIVDHDDPQAGRNFAARFFGVAGDAVTTVGEDYETEVWTERRFAPPAPGEDTAAILDRAVQAVEEGTSTGTDVRDVYRTLAGEELGTGEWPEVLHAALSRNELVFGLNEELATPRALEELPPALEARVGRPVTEAEVLAWLTLGAAARRDGRPLLRPVVHGFVRGIGGAVVSFPAEGDGPRLWLTAEDDRVAADGGERLAQFPVATCTVCGQHYYVAFLRDFTFTRRTPGGGDARAGGTCWEHQEKQLGGRRVVLVDTLIGADEEAETTVPHARTAPLHFCRSCGAAHPMAVPRCLACGRGGDTVRLLAIRQKEQRPGLLTSCLSCGSTGSTPNGGRYREPARPVRAINVADVHVLAQDMVHRAQRPRLLVFCDNRQDAAFQAGWMKDHARRFRLRALMAEGIRDNPQSIGDLVAHLDDRLESDEALSRALIPEVWEVARREHAGGRHAKERRKYLRFQVLREITLASRQALGLEPWGRMKVDYAGLDASLPWIQQRAHDLGISAEHLREGVASVLDYLRRRRALHDPEHELFTKYWKDGDPEVQQGYLPNLRGPAGTKLRRESAETPALVIQWSSEAGQTTMRQIARKWEVPADASGPFLESLFAFLVERGLLVPVRLKGSRGRPLPNVSGVHQVSADRLRLSPNRGVWRCRSCRRTTTREPPHRRCIAWRCDGIVEWVPEDEDSYDLQLLDGAYSMLRSEEHTAMVPADERERLENLFKGDSEAVNCLVCTPTLELGIDIGRLDSVLMRNVPPLPANYRQRAGRAGRRHRMAVDLTYCRPVSHDRAYFAEPLKLLDGRIDAPAFNLRNDVMVAKHVHATIIGALHGYGRATARPEGERAAIRDVLHRCLPRRVEPYLFEDGEVRSAPFDFGALRDLVQRHAADLAVRVQAVFRQGWPAEDAGVATSAALGAHVDAFTDNLEHVVARLRSRLQWAMRQIARLNALRERHGTLEPDDEALFRRCDRLVKRLKGTDRRSRRQAEGHDDVNTFSVLAAEGFLPGYGLEVGSVVGWAEIPFWRAGAMDFSLPRPPATALREYVPGNLIYANGHRFVARRFRRDLHGAPGTGSRAGGDRADMPYYEVSVQRQAVRETRPGETSSLSGTLLQTMAVCDTDLIHTSHISDEEDLRFQLGVAIYGTELGQHSGGRAFRWGPQRVQLRQGVRLRLVNVGPAGAVERLGQGSAMGSSSPGRHANGNAGQDGGGRGELGYPVCTVCGQSVSPLSSDRQRKDFRESHAERCGRVPEGIGFHADVTADVLSLPGCDSAATAYSVLEALRIGGAQVLDMHLDDLQVLVIGHVDRDDVDALLWDPMPGGSGLLDQLCERFQEVVQVAREVVGACPGLCESSCIDCLQSFRNAYYHRYLDREAARERIDEWGQQLSFEHEIPRQQPDAPPAGDDAVPVNDAETKLRHLLLAAGFGEGVRDEQIRLDHTLGTTTPDVIYRTEDHDPDEGVCIYLDGLSAHLHGNPETAERDREIRTWLRNHGFEVIEITAHDLDDEEAMVRHFRRLAGYLAMRDVRSRVKEDRSWFRDPSASGAGASRSRLRLVASMADVRDDTCVPLVPLAAAAGTFGDPHAFSDQSEWEWVEVETARSLRPGMFVAQVVGHSMEPNIPDGSYCLFARPVTGTRQGKTVLVQLRDGIDPDTGERFTVKRYRSQKATDAEGWRHVRIVLAPTNPDFAPIELTTDDEDSVTVVAELVEVVGTTPPA